MAECGYPMLRKEKIQVVESLPDFEKDSFKYVKRFPQNDIRFFMPFQTGISFKGNAQLEFAFRGNFSEFRMLNKENLMRDERGNTALHVACSCGHLDLVKEAHKAGMNVNARNNLGQTPLFVAVVQNHTELVVWLTSNGADVNITDSTKSHHLLHVSAFTENLTIVSHLLECGVDIDIKDDLGRTPVMAACQQGHAAMLQMLMKHGANITLTSHSGANCLVYAAMNSHVKVMQMLLEKNMSLAKQCDGNSVSVLSLCAQHGNLKVVSSLVEMGVDVNMKDSQQRTALMAACEEGHADIVEYIMGHNVSPAALKEAVLVSFGAGHPDVVATIMDRFKECEVFDRNGNSLLILAAFIGDSGSLLDLISRKADLNYQNHDGLTALMASVLKGDEDVVATIISAGVDLNIVNNHDLTALDLAWIFNQPAIVEMLNKHTTHTMSLNVPLIMAERNDIAAIKMLSESGYDIHQQNELGITPLMIACYYGRVEMVQFLLSNRESLMKSNVFGATAVAYALETNQTEAVDLLFGHGASVNDTDQSGLNLLHTSILEKDREFVRKLIQLKADVNYRTYEGLSPLMLAAQRDDEEIVQILVKNGANVEAVSNEGMVALEYAFISNSHRVSQFLQDTKTKSKTSEYSSPLIRFVSRSGSSTLHEHLQELLTVPLGLNPRGLTLVLVACLEGNLEDLQQLVDSGHDLHVTDSTGENPLTLACIKGHNRIVDFLLQQGFNPNWGDFDDITGLMCACHFGKHEVIDILLRHKALINLRDNTTGRSALMAATCSGREEVVRTLLEHNAVVDIENYEGVTPLAEACLRGRISIAELLVIYHADIEHQDYEGRTPMMAAASEGHLNVAKFLYSKGAKLNSQAHDGKSPLDYASVHCHRDMANWLNSELSKAQDLFAYGDVLGGNDKMLKSIDSNSISANSLESSLVTDVEKSIQPMTYSLTDVIVSEIAGELVNTERTGANILNLAVLNENLKTVDDMKAIGLLDEIDSVAIGDIVCALLQQGYSTNSMCIEMLHFSPANMSELTKKRTPMLHHAITFNRLDLLVVLIENGADVNTTDTNTGQHALTVALESGNYEAACFLLVNDSAYIPDSVLLITEMASSSEAENENKVEELKKAIQERDSLIKGNAELSENIQAQMNLTKSLLEGNSSNPTKSSANPPKQEEEVSKPLDGDQKPKQPRFSSGGLVPDPSEHTEAEDIESLWETVDKDTETTTTQDDRPTASQILGDFLSGALFDQSNSKYDRYPEVDSSQAEDPDKEEHTWIRCNCARTHCYSCKAEKLAIVTFPQSPKTQTAGSETTGSKGETQTSKYTHTPRDKRRCENKRSVFLSSVTNDTTAAMFLHCFATAISDATLEGHECAASPCALAALLFAQYFLDDPDDLQDVNVSDKLYGHVVKAIERAIDLHRNTYGNKPVVLQSSESCDLLKGTSSGRFEVVAMEICGPKFIDTLINYILQLQPRQALLLSCEEPYKVVSIVEARGGQGIVLFHPQGTFEDDAISYKGAFLLYSTKKAAILSKTLFVYVLMTRICAGQPHSITVVQM